MQRLFITLVLILLPSCFFTFLTAQNQVVFDVCPILPPGTGNPGEIIEIPLVVANIAEVDLFQLEFLLDPTELLYIGEAI
ncbi:MAG: hypothetical protein AAFU03_09170 [Bacteroidota bacterium]